MAVGLARPLAVGLANAVYLGGKIPRQGQGQTGSLKLLLHSYEHILKYFYHYNIKGTVSQNGD
jgi:hypothetical protein